MLYTLEKLTEDLPAAMGLLRECTGAAWYGNHAAHSVMCAIEKEAETRGLPSPRMVVVGLESNHTELKLKAAPFHCNYRWRRMG